MLNVLVNGNCHIENFTSPPANTQEKEFGIKWKLSFCHISGKRIPQWCTRIRVNVEERWDHSLENKGKKKSTSTFFHSSYKGYIQHITLKMLQLLNMKAERRTYIIITYQWSNDWHRTLYKRNIKKEYRKENSHRWRNWRIFGCLGLTIRRWIFKASL